MTTINNIYFNNNEYTQMWLNGAMIWSSQTTQTTNQLVRKSLESWRSDLQYYDIYTPDSTSNVDNVTITSDSVNRSLKLYCNTSFSIYGGATVTKNIPFNIGKYYKISFKIRGKYQGTYSSGKKILNTNTYPSVSIYLSKDSFSEIEYLQFDFVMAVDGYTHQKLNLSLNGSYSADGTGYGNYTLSGDWIEIKDFMMKEYDTLPPIPKNDIYNSFTYQTLSNISIGNYYSSSYGYGYSTDTTNNVIKYYCDTSQSYSRTKSFANLEPCQKYKISGLAKGTNSVGDIKINSSLTTHDTFLLYDNGITINETDYTPFTVYVDTNYTSYFYMSSSNFSKYGLDLTLRKDITSIVANSFIELKDLIVEPVLEVVDSDSGTTEPTVTYGNILTSLSSCSVNEGNSTTIGVKLDKAPTNNQTVSVSINSSYTTLSTTSLTFTPSNYSTYQYITVTANNDGAYTNRTETLTLSSSNVSSKTVTVNVTNTETQESGSGNGNFKIDYTTSTSPTLPSSLTVSANGTYKFSHGTYTSGVYGLVPSNGGISNSTAYTRFKFVVPSDGTLTFVNRCSSEGSYDYFTIHVNESTSQPSYSSSTNRLVYDSGTTYQSTDHTTTKEVTSGTTYYIHIQYRKDSSGNTYYDKGCLRSIEFTGSGSSSGGNSGSTTGQTIVADFTTSSSLPSCMTFWSGSNGFTEFGTIGGINGLRSKLSPTDSTYYYTEYDIVAPKTGTMKFCYSVSSESGYDTFGISIQNQSVVDGVSGEISQAWSSGYSVTKGTTYLVRFAYSKDESGESGEDGACIHKIVIE